MLGAADGGLAEIFRAEAGERVDRMTDLLVATDDPAIAAETISSLFREAHSIKGSAGMVGFDQVLTIAHGLEDRIGAARERGVLDRESVDAMLELVNSLRSSIAGDPEPAEPAPAAPEGPVADAVVDDPPAPVAPSDTAVRATMAPAAGQSIRMPAEKVDRLLDAIGESVLQMRRFEHVLDISPSDENADWELSRGKVMFDELQRVAIDMRTLPLRSISGGYPRAVRNLARAEGKEVELVTAGMETQLDRVILDGITDAIAHLLRNSIAHGIESPADRVRAGKAPAGRIELRAEPRGGTVAVEVADDGRGVSEALLATAARTGSLVDVLCAPGFSTADQVSDVAGRGVGLDAVKEHVESLGGSMEIDSITGSGTTVRLLLPYSVALTSVLLIERDGQSFGIPLANVEEVTIVEQTLTLAGRQALEVRGHSVPLDDLATVIGAASRPLARRPRSVIVRSSGRRHAIACDSVRGEQDVVVKGLGALLGRVPGYLGAAILDSGSIAPILDPAFLTSPRNGGSPAMSEPDAKPAAPKILVVDDQFTVRELQRSILEAAGYRVAIARDGREAGAEIAAQPDIDLVVSDVQMPEMDGIELLRSIRAHPHRSSLPVVLLTSLGSDEDKRRGVEAGADAYIVKDEFDQRALLDTVERLIVR